MQKNSAEHYRQVYKQNESQYLEQFKEYVRFQSISTDPAPQYKKACKDCADWVSSLLSPLGFSSRVVDTIGRPLVLAHRKGEPGLPTVLIYGHYDVQPVDPIAKWHSAPFEPTIRDGRLYGRGTRDNKGQNLALIKAVETLIKENKLKCGVTVLIEGEEESGSEGLNDTLPKIISELKSDLMLVSDSEMQYADKPQLILGLRGMEKLEFVLTGPNADLHSGTHGGVCRNPARELADIVSRLHKADGAVAVPGFYEGVPEPSAAEYAALAEAGFDEAEYAASIDTPAFGGEQGYPPFVRRGLRPTLEINGMWSGYTGVGFKSIIPSTAHVKISLRLVYDQEPEIIRKRVEDYFMSLVPKGMKCEQIANVDGAKALRVDVENKYIQQSAKVLTEMFGEKTTFVWDGGSIPVLSAIRAETGAVPVLAGFGLPGDNDHSPNESFGLDQFERNYVFGCMMLEDLSRK